MTAVVRQDALPDFEDGLVELSQIRITNAGDGLSEALKIAPRALHIDDEVAILIRGRVTQVNHRKKDSRDGEDDTIVRVHTVKALAATEIEMEHAKKCSADGADLTVSESGDSGQCPTCGTFEFLRVPEEYRK